MTAPAQHTPRQVVEQLPDQVVVGRILAGDIQLFELIMRRYNRRLFRIARGILGMDAEAEDVVQEAYIRAYLKLGQFRGPDGFASWLGRIVTNEALQRHRRRRGLVSVPLSELDARADERAAMAEPHHAPVTDPEASLHELQMRELLEQAIDTLPDVYRVAFVLREVEQLSTSEAAACLGIEAATVKTRVHRARKLLQKNLTAELRSALPGTFSFAGERCDLLVKRVLQRLGELQQS